MSIECPVITIAVAIPYCFFHTVAIVHLYVIIVTVISETRRQQKARKTAWLGVCSGERAVCDYTEGSV